MPRSFVHIWIGTFATNGIILLCGLAAGILSARLLEPEGRGALATVLFWPAIITAVGILSLPTAVVHRRGRPAADRNAAAASAIWISFALAVVCMGVGYFSIPLVLTDPGPQALARYYLLAFVPCNFLGLTLLAIDQSDMRFRRYNLVRLVPSTIYLVGLIVLWAADAISVSTVVWAIWLGTFLAVLVRLYFARDLLRARPSISEGRLVLLFALRFHSGALFALLLAHADRFVVITFWDDTTVGLYVVAFTLATAGLNTVSAAFGELLLPRLAEAQHLAERRRLMGQTLRYAMLLLTLGSGALAVLSPWLLPFLFGNAYAGAVGVCVILLLAYIPGAMRDIITKGLRGTGDWAICLAAEGFSLTVFMLAVWLLASRLELFSIPVALLVANSASLVYLLGVLRRRFDLPLRECWGFDRPTIRQILNHLKQTEGNVR